MALYTSQYLKSLTKETTRTFSKSIESIILEGVQEAIHFDIFLSHSYLDKDEIEGIYLELTKLGYKVYVDWIIDKGLSRDDVKKETADKIKERMNQCDCLFYATSLSTTNSKWMPWELGYMDGKKDKAAIFPVINENIVTYTFKGLEYLSIYPYVSKEKEEKSNAELLWINEEKDIYTSLDSWLKGKKPYLHK